MMHVLGEVNMEYVKCNVYLKYVKHNKVKSQI